MTMATIFDGTVLLCLGRLHQRVRRCKSPRFLSREDIPEELIEKEKEIALEQLNERQRGMADKIIPGKLEAFYKDFVLLEQMFVKDDGGKHSVKDVIDNIGIKVGEKVVLRRFARFQVGEGMEAETSEA